MESLRQVPAGTCDLQRRGVACDAQDGVRIESPRGWACGPILPAGSPGLHRSRLDCSDGRPTTAPHAHRRAEPGVPRLLRAAAADHVGRHAGQRRVRLPPDRAARHAGREAGLRDASASTSAGRSSASTPTPSTRPAARACRTTCARSSRSCARSPQMMSIPIRELEGYEADDVIGTPRRSTASGAGVDTYDRVRRPRRAAAGRRPRPAADHADGRGGHGHLRRGQGHGALRPAPGPDARLQGAQGRHLRQHPRRAGRGGEDRDPACSSSSGRSTASTSSSTR